MYRCSPADGGIILLCDQQGDAFYKAFQTNANGEVGAYERTYSDFFTLGKKNRRRKLTDIEENLVFSCIS